MISNQTRWQVGLVALAVVGQASAQTYDAKKTIGTTSGMDGGLSVKGSGQSGGPGIARKGSLLGRNKTLLPPSPTTRQTGMPLVLRPNTGQGPVTMQPRGPVDPRGQVGEPRDRDGVSGGGGGGRADRDGDGSGGRIAVGSGGVTVDGVAQGDDWRVGLHIGHPAVLDGRNARFVWPAWGIGRRWSWSGWSWPQWCDSGFCSYGAWSPVAYWNGAPYADPFVAGVGQPDAAAPKEETPARAPTAIERGVAQLRSGDAEAAVNSIREHVDANPDDVDGVRLLAIAMLDAKRVEEAAAMLALGYERDPSLAARPLTADMLGGGPEKLRQRVLSAVVFANRVETASSWLQVAVLMQAEGRLDTAKKMLDRAIKKKLSSRIAADMGAALGR